MPKLEFLTYCWSWTTDRRIPVHILFFKKWANPGLFLFIFVVFTFQFK